MPLNMMGFVAGVVLAQNQGVESGQVMQVALPAALLPNTAMGVAVSDMLAQQQVSTQEQISAPAAVAVPTVTGVSPTIGTPGTAVTITGANLGGATAVSFGDTPAGQFTSNADGTITAQVPKGTIGSVVNVTVTTPGGTSTPISDQFVFGQVPSGGGVAGSGGTGTAGSGAAGTAGSGGTGTAGAGATGGGDGSGQTQQLQLVPAVSLALPRTGSSAQPGDTIKIGSELWQGVGPGVGVHYQWLLDGEPIERADRAQYKVKEEEEGSKLQLQVVYGDDRTGFVITVSRPVDIRRKRTSRAAAGEVAGATV
jgi:hypothetical protein